MQHPVNIIDPHYLSFIRSVLPNIRKKGLGLLAMKTNAMGPITKNGIATIDECLRFAWSQDVDTVVSGAETPEQLEHNVLVLKTLKPMSAAEISELLARTAKGPTDRRSSSTRRAPRQRVRCGIGTGKPRRNRSFAEVCSVGRGRGGAGGGAFGSFQFYGGRISS